jgi:hypothetical protein
MKFMMLVKMKEKDMRPPPPELLAAIHELTEDLTRSGGAMVDTGGLMPSAQGARIRAGRGKLTIVDGPFTEGKELIGGYAVIDLKSKEHAMEQGRKFMQAHLDVFGPDYEAELEIRQMADLEEVHAARAREQELGSRS